MNRRDFIKASVAVGDAVAAGSCIGLAGIDAPDRPDRRQEPGAAEAGPWIRPGPEEKRPVWGIRGGIQVGIWPADVEGRGMGGPRGLLRIGYPILDEGKRVGLINFIAVEPIVKGRRGYSELERSGTDDKPGRLFWTGETGAAGATPDPGTLRMADGVERLSVRIHVERFSNGAQPIIDLELRADRPGEICLTASSVPGSAKMDMCVLTATMGNYSRLRQLWLRDKVVRAETVWPDFAGDEFTEDALLPKERFVRMEGGDLLACATTDEADPHAVPPDPAGPGWAYRGSFPLTQYWRVPKENGSSRGLKARVNGRRVYWATHNPIPGGLAYENFDLIQPFREGQTCIFGLTRRFPADVARGLLS